MSELSQISRTLLLVDDEVNIINALKRTLRPDGYTILTANNGEEGLALLAEHEVGVIISDQRMPHMTGVEFLRKVKLLYPKTLRIVLSGYTELESVTSAINEGAIYKFLTKPWDDDLLRDNIREAFQYHEMEQENLRLSRELRSANEKLSILNQYLEQKVVDKSHEIIHSINLLQISQEILEHLPIGIIGIDEQNMIVVSNKCAEEIFGQPPGTCLLGLMAGDALPDVLLQLLQKIYPGDLVQLDDEIVTLNEGVSIRVLINTMGDISQSKGIIIVLSPLKES
ncbi:response regulator [Methylobacter tundripaludum]|uniref:Putative PAS/PAC sensor protein n=1 Tax=Methylobacter tundripaludum (strain ATCC BAA-1195 / DSM 17260 / SV96) TaxID=697282 RepID=G3IYA7_METTV|nr:response regulator [Methylobacter tundripaludum]EGW20029.1 putative PAS/PAC sensor protein [Methylobacter tundripaludum SV96]